MRFDFRHPDGDLPPSTLAGDPIDQTGPTLQWKAKVKKPFPVTLAFDVTIDGDKLSGKFKPGMFPAATVTGVRA